MCFYANVTVFNCKDVCTLYAVGDLKSVYTVFLNLCTLYSLTV